MNDSENSSAGWGDPESIVDERYGRRSLRNTLATIGVLLIVAGIGIGIIFWRQHEKKKTASIEANAKFISQAIVKRVKGTGVPPGMAIFSERKEPLLSWRVSLLPYLEQRALLDEFDLDSVWDSEANLPLSEIVVPCYQSERGRRRFPGCTNWVAVVGPTTVIREKRATRNEYASVQDQIAFIELLDSFIPWTQPRDVTIEEAIKLIRSSGEMGGLFCGTGNGRVIRVSANTSDKELRRLLGD
jgi:hypothetical protein